MPSRLDPIDNTFAETGPVTDAAVTAVGATYDAAVINANLSALTAKINELISVLEEADIVSQG